MLMLMLMLQNLQSQSDVAMVSTDNAKSDVAFVQNIERERERGCVLYNQSES